MSDPRTDPRSYGAAGAAPGATSGVAAARPPAVPPPSAAEPPRAEEAVTENPPAEDPAVETIIDETSAIETPEQIRRRAVALVDYLLAVRALLERPSRTIPTQDAYWQDSLPQHPACGAGPHELAEPSWLRVGRPALPAPPRIPTGLVRHLVWDLSPNSSPTLLADAGTELPAEVREEFLGWYEQQWRPWSEAFAAAQATRELHERLYDLRYRLDIDAARSELVWGHLVLDAEFGGQRLRYPLLVTPVAIGYDPESTTVTVTPEGPPRLQPDALAGLPGLDERRVGDLLALGGSGGQLTLDPWDQAQRHAFAERALRRLGLDPAIHTGGPGRAGGESAEDVSGGSGVWDTGVLFARPRQRMVRRFLEQLRERLLAADPSAVGALASILSHEPSALRMPGDQPQRWERTGRQLLMPMATNEAQESIARRLASHRGVAVQGPPGTGKTHTIRNLICHLVAHGQRVLVLAQKEDPLRVLRDGLPEEIQPLCLAILGRSADQLVQLQVAARELSDRAATLDQPAAAGRLARLREETEQAQRELAQAQSELATAAQRDAATYAVDGRPVPASAVGQWLREHEAEHGVIPDPIGPATDPPLTAAEFAILAALAAQIPPADRAAARGKLPTTGALPSGEAIAAADTSRRDAGKVVEALRDQGLVIDAVRQVGAEQISELAASLRAAAEMLARRESSWTDRLGQLLRDPSWQQVWDHHIAACQQLMAELAACTAFVAGREIELGQPHADQPRLLLERLSELRARLAAGRKVGRLARPELARVAAACLVDGEPLRTAADADLVIATVRRAQLRRQLANRWEEWAQRLALPPADGHAELWAGQLLAEAVDALDWDRRRWPALHAVLASIHPGCPRSLDARQAGELAGMVEACGNVFRADQLSADRRALGDWLRELAEDPAASPVVRQLYAAWEGNDLTAWDAAVAEIDRLWAIRDDALRYVELADRLAAAAPQWAAVGEPFPAGGEAALRAWRWRQAQTWFAQTTGAHDTVALARQIEWCRARLRRLTREMVVASAWLEVARTLDDRRKAALADWTAALRKIGKGTGKSAAHWQAAAQRAMTEAVTAVPVWIMSIDRAFEQFQTGPGGPGPLAEDGPPFDVVVVDEASQADVFSLPVLTLARRAVVVGDDQQIGPQLVGAPSDRVNALIRNHLVDVPSAPHFDTESSLYDHAVRRSPQRILLTEHFRSVPSIIAFSSDTYYDGKIQPLRADRPAGIGQPVTAVAVPDGRRQQLTEFGQVNVAEAEALVAKVAAVVADPAYDGRSLGVVSLLSSSGQAAYLLHRLRAEIGAEELERRSLRVGDAYTFQGDERDVVFVSMVVASADGDIGAFTKRDFHRRINVAASRARDQLWVFHSIGPAELAADDARALLLAHALQPPAVPGDELRGAAADPAAAASRCDSEFERAVLRRLLDRGLDPLVQYRIGEHRIDFVLPAPDGRRLAVECDGDGFTGGAPGGAAGFTGELRRQAMLERVGNCVFVRLRASVFHRDPETAMRPVWERAAELGLVGGSGARPQPDQVQPSTSSSQPAAWGTGTGSG